MSHILRHAAPSIAAALLALTAGCGQDKSGGKGANTFATTGYTWADSIDTFGSKARCALKVEYPSEGDAALVDSTRAWVAMALTSFPMNGLAPQGKAPETTDAAALLAATGKEYLESARKDFEEFAADSIYTNYELTADVSELYATDSVVTMTANLYQYAGGAHGGILFSAATFRVSDGRQTGYSVFAPDAMGELLQLVKEGLTAQYFDGNEGYTLDEALIIDPADMQLPATAPYFTKDGLCFVYQQYEITCYAAGMPSCTIPYSEIAPLLKESARGLIP